MYRLVTENLPVKTVWSICHGPACIWWTELTELNAGDHTVYILICWFDLGGVSYQTDIHFWPGVGKVRPAGPNPARKLCQSGPQRSVSCNIMTGPRCHLWSGLWPGISHTQSVTVTQWARHCNNAIWYAISSLQTQHQQQHHPRDSTKWQVDHPTPSFTSRHSRTGTYRLYSGSEVKVSGVVTPRLLQRPLEWAWLPSCCAPLKEDCCQIWIDLLLWAAVVKDEITKYPYRAQLSGEHLIQVLFLSSSSIVPHISLLCAEKSQYHSSHDTVTGIHDFLK